MNDTAPAPVTTVFPVMYRDADNYKRHSTIVVAGTFTDEQFEALRETLDQGEFYAPVDVGLPHLLDDSLWSQTDKDHCWHEMDVDDHDVLPLPAGATVQFESPSAMIEQFTAAASAGWPDQMSDRWA